MPASSFRSYNKTNNTILMETDKQIVNVESRLIALRGQQVIIDRKNRSTTKVFTESEEDEQA